MEYELRVFVPDWFASKAEEAIAKTLAEIDVHLLEIEECE